MSREKHHALSTLFTVSAMTDGDGVRFNICSDSPSLIIVESFTFNIGKDEHCEYIQVDPIEGETCYIKSSMMVEADELLKACRVLVHVLEGKIFNA